MTTIADYLLVQSAELANEGYRAGMAVAANLAPLCIHVKDDHDYGVFFVEQSPVTPRPDGKGVNASATWAAYTSFGVFGHYWPSMGCSFAEFIQGVEEDYLLGKISANPKRDRHASAFAQRLWPKFVAEVQAAERAKGREPACGRGVLEAK